MNPNFVGQKAAGDMPQNTGRWTKAEHALFMQGFEGFGRDWKEVSNTIQTRTMLQCRTHAQKFFGPLRMAPAKALKKDNTILPLPCAQEILTQVPIYIPTTRTAPETYIARIHTEGSIIPDTTQQCAEEILRKVPIYLPAQHRPRTANPLAHMTYTSMVLPQAPLSQMFQGQ
jgi:SHAQKYF class myb-like DNA-binding protein